MNFGLQFFANSVLLGIGLAMDAFSVSLANGLSEANMKKRKAVGIAFVFAFFQALMPMLGWVCVHTVAQAFTWFEKLIPYLALILLCYIGGNMLYDGLKQTDCAYAPSVGLMGFLLQGVATSIDALSVGFTIVHYSFVEALFSSLIIAAVTFVICMVGVKIGNRVGCRLAGKASILGGAILIFIGIEIFLSNIL